MVDDESVLAFYDTFAADYHLIFADWAASVEWQGQFLDGLIRSRVDGNPYPLTVLDCACGIGTQAIGLARQDGYRVYATDISSQAIDRARREAEQAQVDVTFAVADMRSLSQAVAGDFDVVIAFDNAIPHLLTDEELQRAARELRAKTRPGGLFLASTRDYDALLKERPETTSHRVIVTPEGKRVVFQVWDWQDEQYRVTQFIVIPEGSEWQMRYYSTFYRALRRGTLTRALSQAGFSEVTWLMPEESGFYQPIVIAIA
jgi:glycine/sarcosine N-methyltransferase